MKYVIYDRTKKNQIQWNVLRYAYLVRQYHRRCLVGCSRNELIPRYQGNSKDAHRKGNASVYQFVRYFAQIHLKPWMVYEINGVWCCLDRHMNGYNKFEINSQPPKLTVRGSNYLASTHCPLGNVAEILNAYLSNPLRGLLCTKMYISDCTVCSHLIISWLHDRAQTYIFGSTTSFCLASSYL